MKIPIDFDFGQELQVDRENGQVRIIFKDHVNREYCSAELNRVQAEMLVDAINDFLFESDWDENFK